MNPRFLSNILQRKMYFKQGKLTVTDITKIEEPVLILLKYFPLE
jgi:hypothetical protein